MKHFKYKDIQLSLDVSHSAVSQWFSGLTRPNLENMIKLRDEFEIPVDAWLDIKSYVSHAVSMPDESNQKKNPTKRKQREA